MMFITIISRTSFLSCPLHSFLLPSPSFTAIVLFRFPTIETGKIVEICILDHLTVFCCHYHNGVWFGSKRRRRSFIAFMPSLLFSWWYMKGKHPVCFFKSINLKGKEHQENWIWRITLESILYISWLLMMLLVL